MSFSLRYAEQGIWYGAFSLLENDGLQQAVSTRFGGVSDKEYASLNLALHNGDAVEKVIENRRRFAQGLGIDSTMLCTCEQVHGTVVAKIAKSEAGAGSQRYETAIAATDALITNEKNLPLFLFFADCTPILFFDPEHKAIGLAHGGWKGTVGKIAQKTVLAMSREFGTRLDQCLVAIGPAIGPCCYEVDTYVKDQFVEAFPIAKEQIISPGKEPNKWMLDLSAANRIQLEEIGVQPKHIDIAGVCTKCNSDVFFSYRADQGKTGRIGALLCLK
jgi:polyphenol oxidase